MDAAHASRMTIQPIEACGHMQLDDFLDHFDLLSEKSQYAIEARKEQWGQCDPNGNGHASYAEVDRWIKGLVSKHDRIRGENLWKSYRPIFIIAFNDATDSTSDKKIGGVSRMKATTNDFVEQKEFQLLCKYLCIYAQWLFCFRLVGGDDDRLTLDEWKAGYPKLAGDELLPEFAAFADLNDEKATALFEEMNKGSSKAVKLQQWCTQLEQAEIDAGTDLGKALSVGEDLPKKPRSFGSPKKDVKSSRRFQHVEERNDPEVAAECERWWQEANEVYAKRNEPGMVQAVLSGQKIDGDNRLEFKGKYADVLQRDEYELFYKRLVHAFNNDGKEETDLDADEVLWALEKDWTSDSRGSGHVDHLDFRDCVFELAHTWVDDEDGDDDIDKDDFLIYLKSLFPKVFDPNTSTVLTWWNAFVWKKASKETRQEVTDEKAKNTYPDDDDGVANWSGLKKALTAAGRWRKLRDSMTVFKRAVKKALPKGRNVLQVCHSIADLSAFSKALESGGELASVLGTPVPSDTSASALGMGAFKAFTVFAPSAAAFEKVPALVRAYLFDPTHVTALREVLKYHVVESESGDCVETVTLSDGAQLASMQGEVLTYSVGEDDDDGDDGEGEGEGARAGKRGGARSSSFVAEKDLHDSINGARLLTLGEKGWNGVVYVINEVLIPESIIDEINNKAMRSLMQQSSATMLAKMHLKEWAGNVMLAVRMRTDVGFVEQTKQAAILIQKRTRGAAARRVEKKNKKKRTGKEPLDVGRDKAQAGEKHGAWRDAGVGRDGGYKYVAEGEGEREQREGGGAWRTGKADDERINYDHGGYDEYNDGLAREKGPRWNSNGAPQRGRGYDNFSDPYDASGGSRRRSSGGNGSGSGRSRGGDGSGYSYGGSGSGYGQSSGSGAPERSVREMIYENFAASGGCDYSSGSGSGYGQSSGDDSGSGSAHAPGRRGRNFGDSGRNNSSYSYSRPGPATGYMQGQAQGQAQQWGQQWGQQQRPRGQGTGYGMQHGHEAQRFVKSYAPSARSNADSGSGGSAPGSSSTSTSLSAADAAIERERELERERRRRQQAQVHSTSASVRLFSKSAVGQALSEGRQRAKKGIANLLRGGERSRGVRTRRGELLDMVRHVGAVSVYPSGSQTHREEASAMNSVDGYAQNSSSSSSSSSSYQPDSTATSRFSSNQTEGGDSVSFGFAPTRPDYEQESGRGAGTGSHRVRRLLSSKGWVPVANPSTLLRKPKQCIDGSYVLPSMAPEELWGAAGTATSGDLATSVSNSTQAIYHSREMQFSACQRSRVRLPPVSHLMFPL